MPVPLTQLLRYAPAFLTVAVLAALASVMIWALGPGNLLEHLIGSARREASVFMGLIAVFIGLGLMGGAIALLKGRPGWSISLAGLPLLVMLMLLTQ